MSPEEIKETVENLRRRERMKFEQGVMVGMAIGVISCGLVVLAYWVTK